MTDARSPSAALQLRWDELARAEQLATLDPTERAAVLGELTDDQLEALAFDWSFWGRPDQQLPEDLWSLLLMRGGRGSGKTRTGAEGVRRLAREHPGSWGGFIAPTPKDARDLMIEGPSGILAITPPDERPHWAPSLNRLTWPNGTIATVYSAADPEAIRGPNLDWAWADELGKWKFMQRAWDNLRFALRAGQHPQTIVTFTPTGHPLIRKLLSGAYPGTVARLASTYRNAANLAESFLAELIAVYEGTRLGLQELHGEILDEIEGALWTMGIIDHWSPTETDPVFDHERRLQRIVVGVDPSGSKRGAEAGIVVCGLGRERPFPRGYVLEDASGFMSPSEWGRVAVAMFHRWGADRIVAEVNFGADMVEDTVMGIDPSVSFKAVHASRGKAQRAEPIVSLYEQRTRVQHVGVLGLLETELTQWVPPGTISRDGEDIGSNWSPGRLDALVWALTELMIDGAPSSATMARPGAGGRVPGVRPAPSLGGRGVVRPFGDRRPSGLWVPTRAAA